MLRDDDDDDDHVDNQTLRERVNERRSVRGGYKKGKEVNLLVSVQIKALLYANAKNERRKWEGSVKGMMKQIHVLYGWPLRSGPLELWQLLKWNYNWEETPFYSMGLYWVLFSQVAVKLSSLSTTIYAKIRLHSYFVSVCTIYVSENILLCSYGILDSV